MTNQERFDQMLEDMQHAEDSQEEREALYELLKKCWFQLDAGGEDLFLSYSYPIAKKARQWAKVVNS